MPATGTIQGWKSGLPIDLTMSAASVTIRQATADDAIAIWNLRNSAILAQCSGFYPADVLKIWTAGEVTDRFVQAVAAKWNVACDNRSVVGTGIIDRQSGQVDGIFVRPDMMGRGIGRQMMRYLEGMAKQSGLSDMSLDSTLNAAPFYRSCGFVGETISTYHSPRGITLDCVPMEKHLLADD